MTADPHDSIRPAESGDLAAIRSCAREAYLGYIPAIGRAPAPMVADFASQIARGWVWVAPTRTRIAGYIVFYPRADDMFLENVAVHPEFQGQRTGPKLNGFFEDQARDTGFDTVRLYTNAAMAANLSLYPRLGYVQTDRRIEDGFDRVYFEKRL
ncbi:GNAT family N-acetyltransferase [uncultured Marivita sp.]|uniref:GNAT family N-acetyltransferase n=1 Tax=uncultured Marivita sp. TaxID=888080 RepID=UPI0026060CBF|nr:GNAT family N-acetyltransferase [uncultured Marivita sp.]